MRSHRRHERRPAHEASGKRPRSTPGEEPPPEILQDTNRVRRCIDQCHCEGGPVEQAGLIVLTRIWPSSASSGVRSVGASRTDSSATASSNLIFAWVDIVVVAHMAAEEVGRESPTRILRDHLIEHDTRKRLHQHAAELIIFAAIVAVRLGFAAQCRQVATAASGAPSPASATLEIVATPTLRRRRITANARQCQTT